MEIEPDKNKPQGLADSDKQPEFAGLRITYADMAKIEAIDNEITQQYAWTLKKLAE